MYCTDQHEELRDSKVKEIAELQHIFVYVQTVRELHATLPIPNCCMSLTDYLVNFSVDWCEGVNLQVGNMSQQM
jgi:hypothetical protein